MGGMRAWLLSGVLLMVGCGPALEEPAFPTASDLDLPPSAEVLAQPVAIDDDVPPPAPRLRRTKTLGQIDDYNVRSGVGVARGDGPNGTTVIINNNIQQVAPSVVYAPGGGYAYGSGAAYGSGRGNTGTSGSTINGASNAGVPGSGGRGSGGSGSPPPVGGDWPRAPSYGPR
jgi:hypothetical protein